MKKRIFTIFLIMILAITNLSVCYAETGLDKITGIGLDPNSQYLDSQFSIYNNSVTMEYEDPKIDNGSGIERTVGGLLGAIVMALIRFILWLVELVTPTMDSVVLNDGSVAVVNWGEIVRLSYFDATQNELSLVKNLVGFVSSVYQVFRYIALIFFVIAIAAIAVKMIFSSVGRQKQKYKDDLRHWLIGLVLLVVGHWIMIYLIYFSDYLVEIIKGLKDSVISGAYGASTLTGCFSVAAGASIGGHASLTVAGGAGMIAAKLTGLLTGGATVWAIAIVAGILILICVIVYVAMNLKIFKVYLERVIIVGVLIMIFPLVTVFYAFEKAALRRGSTFESWLRTFIEQVYIQPIHAISLLFVMAALNAMAYSGLTAIPILGMVFVIMVLNTVFEIENVVKRVISISGGRLSQPADLMRGAAMAGTVVNAGLAVGNLRRHKNSIGLPKVDDRDENGKPKYKDGKKDPAYQKDLKDAKLNREAILRGTLQGWAFDAMSRSPLHIDKGLFQARLSQGERMRVEKSAKDMILSGKIRPDKINDIVNLMKDIPVADRAQILTAIGADYKMTPDQFGQLASSNPTQFLMGCAKMVEFDPKDKLSDMLDASDIMEKDQKGNVIGLKEHYKNIIAATLVKQVDKAEALEKVLQTNDLIGGLDSISIKNPEQLRGIVAVLAGNAKVDKVFGQDGAVDLSYTVNPATKEQANAVVNNITVNTADYTVKNNNPMENTNIANVISAATGYRKILSPDIMKQIIEHAVGETMEKEFNKFMQTGHIGALTADNVKQIMEEVKKNIKK